MSECPNDCDHGEGSTEYHTAMAAFDNLNAVTARAQAAGLDLAKAPWLSAPKGEPT